MQNSISQNREAVGLDYDSNPDRFRSNVAAGEKYNLDGDVHPEAAEILAKEQLGPVLDMGCGEGRFITAAEAYDLSVIALDQSATMLAAATGDRVRGDAALLPFRSDSFGGVVALWMLYHLPDPRIAIAEAHRVLRPGGLFIAAAPGRYNDPELAHLFPPPQPATFEAENGSELIEASFDTVETTRWDDPLMHLPDRAALALYLKGHSLSEAGIAEACRTVSLPLTLTKRGAMFTARKAFD